MPEAHIDVVKVRVRDHAPRVQYIAIIYFERISYTHFMAEAESTEEWAAFPVLRQLNFADIKQKLDAVGRVVLSVEIDDQEANSLLRVYERPK